MMANCPHILSLSPPTLSRLPIVLLVFLSSSIYNKFGCHQTREGIYIVVTAPAPRGVSNNHRSADYNHLLKRLVERLDSFNARQSSKAY